MDNLVERTLVCINREGMVGDTADVNTFMGGVIDEVAYRRLEDVISRAKAEAENGTGVRLLAGGRCDRSTGWHVYPTIFQVNDRDHWLMQDEFFGPILTVCVYNDAGKNGEGMTIEEHGEFLDWLAGSSMYALTGAIFAKDRHVIHMATNRLRDACGNFYINDKSTGAVVGQQAFGGARMSGTNDKSGSKLNLYRWSSHRSIKETFDWQVTDYCYPHQQPDASV